LALHVSADGVSGAAQQKRAYRVASDYPRDRKEFSFIGTDDSVVRGVSPTCKTEDIDL
jgi:hypothetical protein